MPIASLRNENLPKNNPFGAATMSRKVCISAIDGQTGFLITELFLSNPTFPGKVAAICGLSLYPASAKYKELQKLGVNIITRKPGKVKGLTATLRESGSDTLCIIPPAHKDKFIVR
ncbi:hypothetical protein K432DRAFT_398900 [Lepidopterella palustris CBS 459.81]|uniref:NmrA-like domain-containing protein n=1 Tax=Lepidopterella palustris CBS 459.81 TaxID=1314670 RepID=A0A8E2DXG0_9PEZI|nr:hypothetical protein K432DRAFT_398900 [Lepidopterella palustris CBS 459.81]